MHDIVEYISSNKDISLSISPFSNIDALVFSSLLYLNLESLLKEERTYQFKEIICKKNIPILLQGAMMPKDDKRLIKALDNSTRYTNFSFVKWKVVENPLTLTQFMAVCLKDENERYYIIFRGTNRKIYGWLENLEFGLISGPQSIDIAKDFIRQIITLSKDSKITLIGHSKGGSLVEQAYLRLSKEEKNQISSIYSFDCAGSKKICSQEEINDISPKLKKYITKKTMFGLLLKQNFSYQIVDSRNSKTVHHMSYSWKIFDDKIKVANYIKSTCVNKAKYFNQYVESLKETEIQNIIQEAVFLFEKAKIESIDDFLSNKTLILLHYLSKMKKSDLEDDKKFLKFLSVFIQTFL